MALDSFALLITPPAQRQNDSQLRILDMCSLTLYLSTSLSLNGRIVSVPAFCLFIKRATSLHAFCVSSVRCVLHVATRSRKRYGAKKNGGKKTRNLFSFYANQITHKQQFLLRRWPLLLFGLLSSVFNLNSVWQTNLPTISACCLPASSLLEPFN